MSCVYDFKSGYQIQLTHPISIPCQSLKTAFALIAFTLDRQFAHQPARLFYQGEHQTVSVLRGSKDVVKSPRGLVRTI